MNLHLRNGDGQKGGGRGGERKGSEAESRQVSNLLVVHHVSTVYATAYTGVDIERGQTEHIVPNGSRCHCNDVFDLLVGVLRSTQAGAVQPTAAIQVQPSQHVAVVLTTRQHNRRRRRVCMNDVVGTPTLQALEHN